MASSRIETQLVCRKCRETKSLDHFGKDKYKRLGRKTICKLCEAAVYRESVSGTLAQRNREKKAALWAQATERYCWNCETIKPIAEFHKDCSRGDGLSPRCKACKAAYQASDLLDHPEKFSARSARWYDENRASHNAKGSERVKLNPEANRLRRRRSRARKLLAPGTHSAREAAELLAAQNYLCANPYCLVDLRTTKAHLDHVVALIRGGSNDIGNCQYLCQPCNNRKHARTQEDWLALEAIRAAKKAA